MMQLGLVVPVTHLKGGVTEPLCALLDMQQQWDQQMQR
jgi:hypothetical protein